MSIETERVDGIAADQASDPTSAPAGAPDGQMAASPSDHITPPEETAPPSEGGGSDDGGEAPRRAGPRRAGPRRAGPAPARAEEDGAKVPIIPPKKRPVPRTKSGRTASTARPAGSAVPASTDAAGVGRDTDRGGHGDHKPQDQDAADGGSADGNEPEPRRAGAGRGDSDRGDAPGGARPVADGVDHAEAAASDDRLAAPAGAPKRRTVKGRTGVAPPSSAPPAEPLSVGGPREDDGNLSAAPENAEGGGPGPARVSVRSEPPGAVSAEDSSLSAEAVPAIVGDDGGLEVSQAVEAESEEKLKDRHGGAAARHPGGGPPDGSTPSGASAGGGARAFTDVLGDEDSDAVAVASSAKDDLGPVRPDFVRMVVDGVPLTDGGPTTRVVPALSSDAEPRRAGGRPKTIEESLSAGAPVPVGGGAGPVVVPPSPASAAAASTSVARPGGGPRRVKVQLAQISPWSVMKLGFLLSVGLGIAFVVAVYVVWNVLDRMHLFVEINEQIAEIVGPESAANFDLLQYVELGKVMAAATGIAVINVVLATILATLGSLLYNVTSALVGGIHVTLRDD